MKRLIIEEVDACNSCPYLYAEYGSDYNNDYDDDEYFCTQREVKDKNGGAKAMTEVEADRILMERILLPDWCPLPEIDPDPEKP